MKDRVIKKLQDQVKTLTKTIEKGRKNNIHFLFLKFQLRSTCVEGFISRCGPKSVRSKGRTLSWQGWGSVMG